MKTFSSIFFTSCFLLSVPSWASPKLLKPCANGDRLVFLNQPKMSEEGDGFLAQFQVARVLDNGNIAAHASDIVTLELASQDEDLELEGSSATVMNAGVAHFPQNSLKVSHPASNVRVRAAAPSSECYIKPVYSESFEALF